LPDVATCDIDTALYRRVMRRTRSQRRALAEIHHPALAAAVGGLGVTPDCPPPPNAYAPRADLGIAPDCPTPPN